MTTRGPEVASLLTVGLPSAGSGLASARTWAIAVIAILVLVALGWWTTTTDRRR